MKFEFYYKFNKNFELISYPNSVCAGSKSQCIEYDLNKERISEYRDNYSIDLATNIIDSYKLVLDADNSGFQLIVRNTEILKKLLNIVKESEINKWLFKNMKKNYMIHL